MGTSLGVSSRRKWQPTPVFLPGESQGQRSLVGCCLWGRTESDTTEQLIWSALMGLLWVGHDWATSLTLFTFMHWRRKWQPTPVFLPGESQGQGSLVGCCLWGHSESDMTEQLKRRLFIKQSAWYLRHRLNRWLSLETDSLRVSELASKFR